MPEVRGSSGWLLGLQILAPWLSVLLFWFWLRHAWAAMLGYHAQILYWRRRELLVAFRRRPARSHLAALPLLGSGLLLVWLLPGWAQMPLGDWMAAHQLSPQGFLWMIPWFGLLHPRLEQLHWRPLCAATPWAHAAFAGYHALVLASLLPPWLLTLCTLGLALVSRIWQQFPEEFAVRTHQAADTGIALGALWLLQNSSSFL